MPSILTDMLAGRVPCEKIFEDHHFAAVLEPAPLNPGHAFVFPKQEIESWLEMDPALLADFIRLAQKLAQAIQRSQGCPRVALAAYGLKTPHVHFHLIPVWGNAAEVDLTRSRPASPPSELALLADTIRKSL